MAIAIVEINYKFARPITLRLFMMFIIVYDYGKITDKPIIPDKKV
jgi:hypothetical protein